eukprot:2315602-Amphidinium_carterae.1
MSGFCPVLKGIKTIGKHSILIASFFDDQVLLYGCYGFGCGCCLFQQGCNQYAPCYYNLTAETSEGKHVDDDIKKVMENRTATPQEDRRPLNKVLDMLISASGG